MSQVEQLAKIEQFLRLPETKPASEYLDGRIIQKVSPKAKHSLLQGRIIQRINGRTEPRRVGLAFPELRSTFGGRSLVFEIAYFRWERIALDENGEPLDDVFTPPDLAVEVISPGQREAAAAERLSFAVRHGVQLGWLINPRTRRVKVFRPGEPVQSLKGRQVLEGGPMLGGFRCSVDELFGWLKLA
jgi:Uma2 family endonuclease